MPRGEKTYVPSDEMKGFTEEQILKLPKTLNSRDVACLMRISSSKVCDLAGGGTLPGVKVGKTWRFDRDAILEIMGMSMTDIIASANRRRIAEETARAEWERSMRENEPAMLGQGQLKGEDASAIRALMNLLAQAK